MVIAVGLQAPAVSVGLRWVPGPRSRTLDLIPIEPFEIVEAPGNWPNGDTWPSWFLWALAALIFLAISVVAVRLLRHLHRRAPATHIARIGADSGVPSEADARILQSGLAAAIEILSSDRDLSNAVVQAWQGLQDAAATAGLYRRPAETASEFTARILYRSRGSAEPIAVLLSLYQRVRFGEHAPEANEIDAARHSLAVLVNLWQADFPQRRKPRGAR